MNENATRIEAFSDGVFAIAITLLILEIKVPGPARDAAALWAGLLALWPSYLAFLFSFVVILIMWVNHHELLRMVSGVNYPFLFANGMLLLCITFLPFPTAVLAAHLSSPDARAAVAFYCATMFVSSLMWNALFVTIVRYGLLRSSVSAETVARVRRAYYGGVLVYLAATLLAFVKPWLGLAVNVSLWVLWIRLGYRAVRTAGTSDTVTQIEAPHLE